MARSNYPNGFPSGVTIRGIPLTQAHPGQVFWVSNATTLLTGQRGGSNGNNGTFDSPFSTLDYAIGRCVANRGDIIFAKPGHAENLATAAVIAADVAGVAIIGLGVGSNVPTFSWTAAAATLSITAANVSFSNIKFVANFADVTTMFDVSGAGDGLSFENCVFTDTSTILNALDAPQEQRVFHGRDAGDGEVVEDFFFLGIPQGLERVGGRDAVIFGDPGLCPFIGPNGARIIGHCVASGSHEGR